MDNRELASLIWIGIALVGFLAASSVRSAVGQVARGLANVKIALPIVLLAGWTGTLTIVGWKLGLWEPGFTFSTVVWFFGSALALLFHLEKVWKTEAFFRSVFLRLLEITAFVVFFVNLFSLHLAAELLLQPVTAALAAAAVVAHRDPNHKPVARLADGLLAVIGLSLATFTAVQLVKQWDVLDKQMLALELALPIWLTVATLPLIGLLAIYASYESAFLRINHALDSKRERRRVKIAVVRVLRLQLRDVSAFTFYWARQAGTATTSRDARLVVQDFRDSLRAEEDARHEAAARLVRNAGVVGTDDDGQQLDQREFSETRDALHWLATCQMGWHRNRGGRYRADMLDILAHDFTRHGLPEGHGIELHVTDDGQAWWAGRRTVTGWYFAIGAAGPPPEQWEYDGPEPPSGFPGVAPEWGDRPFTLDVAVNW